MFWRYMHALKTHNPVEIKIYAYVRISVYDVAICLVPGNSVFKTHFSYLKALERLNSVDLEKAQNQFSY